MVKVKLNGKPYDFPTCVADLTLGNFVDLRAATNPIEEVCALTGLEKSTVANFKDLNTMRTAQVLMAAVAEDMKKGFGGGPIADRIFINGKFAKVPKDLKIQPYGAWLNVYNVLAEKDQQNVKEGKEKDYTDCILPTLAHYFWLPCHEGQEYNELNVEYHGWQQAVRNIPLNQAIPLANFFFVRFPNLP